MDHVKGHMKGSADLVTGESITLPISPEDISPEDTWSEGEFATGDLVTRWFEQLAISSYCHGFPIDDGGGLASLECQFELVIDRKSMSNSKLNFIQKDKQEKSSKLFIKYKKRRC